MKTKLIREDILLIRIILILFVVIHHTFGPFTGDMNVVYNNNFIQEYYDILKIFRSFRMESFVFISGFLFGLGYMNNIKYGIKKNIIRKAQRLLIPSVIFGSLYYYFFLDLNCSSIRIIYQILIG